MGLVCLASLRSVWLPGSFLLLPVSVLRFFFLLKIYLLIFYWVFILCFIYLFLPMLGLRRCVWAFFSCGEREPPSSWGAWASPCGGFSGCGARALGTRAQRLRLPGSRHMGFSGCGSQAPGRGLISCVHGLRFPAACGTFLDQRLNPCPLHLQAGSLPLSHRGSPSLFLEQLNMRPAVWLQHTPSICPPARRCLGALLFSCC